jgi:peptidyl-prolyl cis-trans isomerase A (cyclophilin A)
MNTRTLAILLSLTVLAACGGDAKPLGNGGDGGDGAAKLPDPAPEISNPLLDPGHPEMTKRAPDTYRAKFETTAGDFVIEVTRSWAPRGADRFYNLVRNGYFDGNKFFRVLPGFIVQWGMSGDPKLNSIWADASFLDDPVTQSNTKGTVTFAMAGKNTRSTHIFVNYGDNSKLDAQGFAPFGRVVEGMDVVESIESEYGQTPDQGQIHTSGDAYLSKYFPNLDRIEKAYIVD